MVGTIHEAPESSDTLRDFSYRWFQATAPALRPATIEVYERAYTQRIDGALGGLYLDELTREQLERWLAKLVGADPHRRSVEQAVVTLSAMLGTAVEWGLIPANTASRLRLPKPPPRPGIADRVLTPEQLDSLYAAAQGLRQETLFRTVAETGIRRGEAIALQWRDVLLDERRLVIRHSVYQDKTGKTTQTPKSGHGRRVAIGRGLADLLKTYRGTSSDDDYVWPGKDGPMSRDTPGQLLERTLDRAGLVDSNGKPLVTFHDLRHTGASIALARGVPLITVSRQLGHARVDTTAKTYAHLLEDRQLDDFADAHER